MPVGSIRDFSNGVLNQNMLNKDSGAGIPYDARNVVTSFNGELKKRTGTRFLEKFDENVKLIPFRAGNNDLLGVLSDLRLRFYELSSNGLNLYSFFNEPVALVSGWTSNTNGTFITSTTNPINPSTVYKCFNRDTSLYGTNKWKIGDYINSTTNPTQTAFYVNLQNSTEFIPANISIIQTGVYTGDTSGPSGFLIYGGWQNQDRGYKNCQLEYSDNGTDWSYAVGYVQFNDSGIQDSYTQHNSGIYKAMTYKLSIAGENITPHKYWRYKFSNWTGGSISGQGDQGNYYMSITMDTSTGTSEADFVTTYTTEDLSKIKFADTYNNTFLACEGKAPINIEYTSTGNIVVESFTPTGTTNIWTVNGYPSCVEFYAGRLWFAGFSAYPNRAMASAFNNFNNFTVPSTILSTSPIIADGRQLKSQIENMFGGDKALYLLSQDGISMIDAPNGGVVATNMIELQLRNREPAAAMTPTVKDDVMIYLGRDKRKILITDYNFVVQRFKAQNLSYNFDDFLSGNISELHYIPSKESLIYGTLENGDWFVHLFNPDLQKNSIFPFNTNGIIYDITPIKYGNETKLIMVVQRGGLYYIEEKISQPDQSRMDLMLTNVAREVYTNESLMSDYIYLDCATRNTLITPATLITDLPYNIGDSVEVLADGIYVGTKIVEYDETSASNALSFNTAVSDVIAGYSYDSYWCLKFATPYVSLKSPKEISTYFINTGYLEVGNSFDDLKPVVRNLVDTVSINSEPVFLNGEYTMTLAKQVKKTPYVIVRSNKGLPFTITGIDYKVDYSNYQGGI